MQNQPKPVASQDVKRLSAANIRIFPKQQKPTVTPAPPLRHAVKTADKGEREGTPLPFPEVEPYPDRVDAARLFDEMSGTILQFIVLTKEQADAATLWIVMTWLIDVVMVAPLAIITAPEKACGKSQLLEVLSRLVSRPLPVAHMSASFLFRAIKYWEPTLLIDEADTFIRENEELKGLVNAGHTRASAYVGRTVSVGDDHEPRLFEVWGAKAFAGIALEKHLPDSTMSRGIVFNLRRKTKDESVIRLRYADRKIFELMASKLARFAADCAEQVREARPLLPDDLDDRAQDNWEPLLAIAECAGAVWLARATAAALSLSSTNDAPVSTGNELLADIQYVFEAKGTDKISSADLIAALCEIDDGAWAAYNHGKPISPRQLSKLLGTYKISPKTVRMKHGTPKGYDFAQFADAFARYLSPQESPQQLNGSPEDMPCKASDVADITQPPGHAAPTRNPDTPVTPTETMQPGPDCGGVAEVAAPARWPGGIPPEDAF